MSQTKLDHRAVRDAVFKALSKEQKPPNQYTSLSYDVNSILRAQGYSESAGVRDSDRSPLFGFADTILREIVWELIAQSILVVGFNDSNTDWPFLSPTIHGAKVIQNGVVSPADPDGFLDRLIAAYPNASKNVVQYLKEAILAFNRRVYLGSTVMLGVGAEGLMLELSSAVVDSFNDPSGGKTWYNRSIKNRPALQQHKAIDNRLSPLTSQMPRELRERYDTHFKGIHGLIRQHRNEAGHPTGVSKDREDVLPLFYLFVSQAGLISDLIEWLGERKRF